MWSNRQGRRGRRSAGRPARRAAGSRFPASDGVYRRRCQCHCGRMPGRARWTGPRIGARRLSRSGAAHAAPAARHRLFCTFVSRTRLILPTRCPERATPHFPSRNIGCCDGRLRKLCKGHELSPGRDAGFDAAVPSMWKEAHDVVVFAEARAMGSRPDCYPKGGGR